MLKKNKKGKNYQADNFKICYRHKNTISGDNSENVEELIYLINGSAEITVKDYTESIGAPAKIKIPAKIYHKIKALTDISFILYEKK